jgi:hypothetical protein
MPQLRLPIGPDGLCVDVLVGVDGGKMATLIHAGQPIPAPRSVRGLIDTGTDVTAIHLPILQGLGIPSLHQTTTRTVGGSLSVNVFEVSLSITNLANPSAPWLVRSSLLVMDLPSALPNIEALIGLDILLGCRLLLDGPARQFTLDF